jgi:uncharacterized membrane protein YsdA (DUF1294 family)
MRSVTAVVLLSGASAAAVAGLLPWWYSSLAAAASLLSLVLYAVDKRAARAGARRVAERTLHLTALIGGWPGALAAQQLFRHKHRKTSFMRRFTLIAAVHLAATVGLALWYAAER